MNFGLVLALLCATVGGAAARTLAVVTEPSDGYGGEAFRRQPRVSALDSSGNLESTLNTGTVYIELGTDPTGGEATVQQTAVDIVDGVATFEGVTIDLVGEGYTLRFISLDLGLQVVSEPFDVTEGDPYQIAIATGPSATRAGIPFDIDVEVVVQDKGGNTVTEQSDEGTVSVFVANNPTGASVLPLNSTVVTFYEGRALFVGAYVDKVGTGYTLGFTTSLTLEGTDTLESTDFRVDYGELSSIAFLSQPSEVSGAVSSHVLPRQATVAAYDGGGNLMIENSASYVECEIYRNAGPGSVIPEEHLVMRLVRGVASFSNLRVDVQGDGYQLKFALFDVSGSDRVYYDDLVIYDDPFDVAAGDPSKLVVTQEAGDAWAGGQEFLQQPAVRLEDAGGNILTDDYSSTFFISMVESLVPGTNFSVNATDAPPARLLNASWTSEGGIYGEGDSLLLSVTFDYDVTVVASDGGNVPLLRLNAAPGGTAVASCLTVGERATELVFQYEPLTGHAAAPVDVVNASALDLNGAEIQDRNGNTANLTFPNGAGHIESPLSGGSVVVNTTAPYVTTVYCTDPGDGTHGIGTIFWIRARFSFAVRVSGAPLLPLRLGYPLQYATYVSGSDTDELLFKYQAVDGDETEAFDIASNDTISLPTFADSITRLATVPTTPANVTLRLTRTLAENNNIAIDSTPPSVVATTGLTTTSSSGNYAPGDVIVIDVPFTDPVSATGVPRILLTSGGYAEYLEGSGTSILRFAYEVQPEDHANPLDAAHGSALELNSGSILRTSDQPTTAANISLSETFRRSNSLLPDYVIVVNGSKPYVNRVELDTADGTYGVDTDIDIRVVFTLPVAVSGDPYLELDAGTATYVSGTGSQELLFRYTVALGDSTLDLDYLSTSSLKLSTDGWIRRNSSAPTYAASLTLGSPGGGLADVAVNTTASRATTVSSVNSESDGVLTLGDVFDIVVTLTDKTYLTSNVDPILIMNTGGTAVYKEGDGEAYLTFMYFVAADDAIAELDIANSSALICPAGCGAVNLNGEDVDFDLTAAGSLTTTSGTPITLNTTAPHVVEVYSSATTSSKHGGRYTIGDEFTMIVVFSMPVVVSGDPELVMDTGSIAAYESGSGTSELVFSLTISDSDETDDLSAVSIELDALTSIKRDSNYPTLDADITLPSTGPVARNGHVLAVNTSITAEVFNVTTPQNGDTLFAGDVVEIDVHFTTEVEIIGYPILYLFTGPDNLVSAANYANSSNANATVRFEYVIQPGDSILDLSYADENALSLQPSGSDIRVFSRASSTVADVTLPACGAVGSLDFNSRVTLFTEPPYVVSVSSPTPSFEMSITDSMLLQLDFSAPVAVIDRPRVRMATGLVKSYAEYAEGDGTTVLLFRYVVDLGDSTTRLDYDGPTAFDFELGAIYQQPSQSDRTPLVEIDSALTSSGGALYSANATAVAKAGEATFEGVRIDVPGVAYPLRIYTPSYGGIRTTITVDVLETVEFFVLPDDQAANDRFGWSVALDGDTLLVGAPDDDRSSYEVQTVFTTGTASAVVNEIQLFATYALWQPDIQTVTISADPYATVGGTWRLFFGTQGPTLEMTHDVSASQLRILLLDAIPTVGGLEVTREAYTYCACEEAYTWAVTFNTLRGDVPLLNAETTSLTGDGVEVIVTVEQESPILDGAFAIGYNGVASRSLLYDATLDDVFEAIEDDLGLGVINVARSAADDERGYIWTVTFAGSEQLYDFDELDLYPADLTGNGAGMWIKTHRAGQAPLGGAFTIGWREDETPQLLYNSSAEEVKSALEDFDKIGNVTVTREGPTEFNGYEWIITFLSTITIDDFGYEVSEPISNLEPLTVSSSLTGTNAAIDVGVSYSQPPSPHYSVAKQGIFGDKTGAAYVMERDWAGSNRGRDWRQAHKLVGSDADEYDFFGTSVDLDGDFALIGAPGDEELGVAEVQNLTCTATGGSFTLSLGYYASPDIPYDTTYGDLEELIEMTESISAVSIDYFAGTLCSSTPPTVSITFVEPRGRDLDELAPDVTNLIGGNVTVVEAVAPTMRTSGVGSTGKQAGSAYVFQYIGGFWVEQAKLLRPESDRDAGDMLGSYVKLVGTTAFVAAPEAEFSKGVVEVFELDYGSGTWEHLATIRPLDEDWHEGDRFGLAIEADDDSVMVSSLGSSQGTVFVFQRIGDDFVYSQQLQPHDGTYDRHFFGSYLDLSQNTLAVCAPGDKTHALDSGAVYVFERPQSPGTFAIAQKLTAGDDAQRTDRFGHRVAIDGNVIVAAQHPTVFVENLTPSREIQEIRTSGSDVGSTFTLKWKQYYDGTVWQLRETSPIEHDVGATDLAVQIAEELFTGELLVSRSEFNNLTGGYTWAVTFMEQTGTVDLLQASAEGLTGTNVDVTVTRASSGMEDLRNKGYVFVRLDETEPFTEYAYLMPHKTAPGRLYGWSMDLEGETLAVGVANAAPSRSSVNTGGLFMYRLGVLDVHWSESQYAIEEGGLAALSLERCGANGECIFESTNREMPAQIYSYDRIANASVSNRASAIYHLTRIPDGKTALEVLFTGAAMPYTVPSDYGDASLTSKWRDGVFDYFAIGDYVPLSTYITFQIGETSLGFEIEINDDTLMEVPDETVVFHVLLPGMWPSKQGPLWTELTIEDDGDALSEEGLRGYFEQAFPANATDNARFGSAVAVHDDGDVAIVGAPREDVGGSAEAGKAFVFTRAAGLWTEHSELLPPDWAEPFGHFGESVCVFEGMAVVGRPRTASLFVYNYNETLDAWEFDVELSSPDYAYRPQDYLGGAGSLSCHRDMVVAGAREKEAFLAFYRNYTGDWQDGHETIHSDDYDYDFYGGEEHVHRANFGYSVASDGRTVAVGAPWADYGNKGTDEVETYDTDGVDNAYYGKGAAYVFYWSPQLQTVHLRADSVLSAGNFRLNFTHRGESDVSAKLGYGASASAVQTALNDLSNIVEVEVTRSAAISKGYVWTVSFTGEVTEVPQMEVMVYPDCGDCTSFSSGWSGDTLPQLYVDDYDDIGPWEQVSRVQAPDKRYSDKFGSSVAIDGDLLAVGAIGSGAQTSTTWSFETGDLIGWRATGDAFDYQPTFTDNSLKRTVYDGLTHHSHGASQPAKPEGMYYIGTYELRPGNGAEDHATPHPDYSAGDTQGDEPTGTLTSDSFVILGDWMSFRIGGGCDVNVEYVELVIDGVRNDALGKALFRATGRCRETMQTVTWDLSSYINSTAFVVIGDESGGGWGHINVDDFRFGWDSRGGAVRYHEGSHVHYASTTETPLAGAVYAFRETSADALKSCPAGTNPVGNCEWQIESAIVSPDRRPYDRFGRQLAVHGESGTVAVSSAYQTARDLFGVAVDQDQAGAVYVYRRVDWVGTQQSYYRPTYTARLQAVEPKALDHFGYSLAMSGYSLLVGAPDSDSLEDNGGSVFFVDAEFNTVTVAEEVIVAENDVSLRAEVSLTRTGSLENELHLHYAVSEYTAVGIADPSFTECMDLPVAQRNCHDYMQDSGQVTFAEGEEQAWVFVYIVNDNCYEPDMEFAFVTISVPGGPALGGQEFVSRIRIDDDDFGQSECSDPTFAEF